MLSFLSRAANVPQVISRVARGHCYSTAVVARCRFASPTRSLLLRAKLQPSSATRILRRGFVTSAATTTALGSAATPGTVPRATRMVGYWLLTTAGAVFVMVVLGGVTRLTRSGLSIVEWRPEGEILPRTPEAWHAEFAKYKQFPEFKKTNQHMTLDEFKPIYLMEWAHRQWGRAIGLLFALPLVGFAAARALPPGAAPRLGVLLALGAAQGGVGWWMVRSGLEEHRFTDEWSVPRVSPYRLATHVSVQASVTCPLYSRL